MRRTTSWTVSTLLALVGLAPQARAQFASLETDDLRLVYISPTMSFVTPHAARCFENSMGFQRRLFGYAPSEKISVLLLDLQDSGNASAGAVPRNNLSVQLAPLHFTFETMLANERMNTLMNHELVHIVTNDKPGGSDRFFRGLFQGKVAPVPEQPESILYFYLTNPRIAAPRWFHEGIAVFADTWMAGGLGRAQGAYDEMVFRSMVRDGSRFYDPLGLASEGTKIDFQTETNSYLYGTRFMSWLASHYSPETLVRWFTREKGSRAYYSSDFERVFGTSLDAAWREWVKTERAFQQKNLEAIRQYPTTPYNDISKQALGSISRGFVDPERRTLYAALNYPGIVGHIAAVSLGDGSIAKLRDVKQPRLYAVASLAFDPDERTLFYTTDNVGFRDIVALDPRTKKSRVLLKDARIGDLVFSHADRALWGIRIYNGACTLVRIPYPYKEWNQVHTWPYGEVIYDLDVSPDGKLIAVTHAEINGKQSVHVLSRDSLLAQDVTPLKQFDFGSAIPQGFVFSLDGRYLYGSSYYTGAANIFRYEIETGALEAVSNTETGFFRPIPLGGDELIVFRYTGEGLVPTRIEAKPLQDVSAITFFGQELAEAHPVLKDWKVGSPAEVPLDSLVKRDGPYRSFASIGLESLYPVVQGYKDGVAPGLRFNFSDPLQFNNIALSAAYSIDDSLPDHERLHATLDFRRYDWSASARYNPADFYDLFGPTKTSRKGYAFGLGYDRLLVYDAPRTIDLKVRAEFWGDLEELPDYQGVATTSDKLFQSSLSLHGRYVRNSIGFVDDEKGREWRIVLTGDVADGRGYFGARADLDFGFGLPLGHSSVWLRNTAGFSPGDIDQPYSNFFFGGFRNNWVDHQDEKRYRTAPAFPGAEINEISGRNYVRSMFEWNLPPIRFRRAGTPGFYVTWARPALFASGLVTNLDDTAIRRELVNVGGQLDFRFTLLSRLDMTLSGGYAVAFEEGFPTRHEWMASLKVLR
jgi:hypothetical protein